MKETFQSLLMSLVDGASALLPQPVPEPSSLRACKIVSHRGEHDGVSVRENTLCAFRAAGAAGVWGIECDIRWTADLTPVIVHDPTAIRVFGDDTVIGEVSFRSLRQRLPEIPSLAELVEEFGGNIHLMLEIKDEVYQQPKRQQAILADILRDLDPVSDYHFLSLDPALFRHVPFAPPRCYLPVAEFNVSALSRLSLDSGYGGLTGHYLLLTESIRCRHAAVGQHIGTGHIGSRNALFREINRGVEWIFSNDAAAMQRLLHSLGVEPRDA